MGTRRNIFFPNQDSPGGKTTSLDKYEAVNGVAPTKADLLHSGKQAAAKKAAPSPK